MEAPHPDEPVTYFNYFTEIEEHFQRARGSSLFLLSPLDWALVENWKNSGLPLEAVLKGIDAAFEKWRSRKVKSRSVNSLAYCTQAVMEAAERAPTKATREPAPPPFSADDLRAHLTRAAGALRPRPELALRDIASALDVLAAEAESHLTRLEDLERRLTALEEKTVAALRASAPEDQLYAMRDKLDRELRPYRGKMTADQIALLERRYLDSALLESAALPRLSLFYVR